MKRTNAPLPILVGIASVLMLAMLATTAVPVAAGEPWRAKAAERLAVKLTNCLRSGGYVRTDGTCKGWGTGKYAKPRPLLKRSHKIANKVAWPWARRSIKWYGTRSCWIGHERYGSTVDKRFARVGLKYDINGENMGCGLYGSGKRTVIRVVRMWQAEKSYGGWHWRQLRSRTYKSLGVGVARYGSRKTQLVMNFYGKRVR